MYSWQILERKLLLLTILWLAIMSLPVAGAQNRITFWTTEVEKDRLEIQRDIARTFTRKTGTVVRVIPVQENLLTQRVTAAFSLLPAEPRRVRRPFRTRNSSSLGD